MLRVLEEHASKQGVPLAPMLEGDVDFPILKALFELEDSHAFALAVFLGGSLPLRPLES